MQAQKIRAKMVREMQKQGQPLSIAEANQIALQEDGYLYAHFTTGTLWNRGAWGFPDCSVLTYNAQPLSAWYEQIRGLETLVTKERKNLSKRVKAYAI